MNTVRLKTSASKTPAGVHINPRNREHDIAEALAGDWAGDVFQTAWFNALSITFPIGEKFFIDSVRATAVSINDEKLQKEISAFCGQEGFHRREHQRYNEALCQLRGYSLEVMEKSLRKRIGFLNRHFSDMERLAATTAVEHITAILAELLLGDDSIVSQAPPAMAELWRWHALEETEHKSVTFDLYVALGGKYDMRCKALKRATLFITLDVSRGILHMTWRDRSCFNPLTWLRGARFLFGREGVLRRGYPIYKEFFRQDFHPWQQGDAEDIAQWQQQYS